jgi:hypothetical protein
LEASVRQLFRADLTGRLDRIHVLLEQTWKDINAQTRIVNRLAMDGYDTSVAEQLLHTYEQTLSINYMQLHRLQRELTWPNGPAALLHRG